MSLHLRLTLWYAGLLTVVLAAALALAYGAHVTAHVADDDAVLRHVWVEMAGDVRSDIANAAPGISWAASAPASEDDFTAWLYNGPRLIASAGRIQGDESTRDLPDGYSSFAADGTRFRAFALPIEGLPAGYRLVVASSFASLDQSLVTLREQLALLGVGGVLVAVVVGFLIAGGALRPVALLTETARSIRASRAFSRRVPTVARHDELGTLARTFNEMLDGLEETHRQQRRFVADVSHELRTPLTTIGGNAELLLDESSSARERREAAEQIERESRRLSRLVDDLLSLARADAGPEPFAARPVELDELVMETFEDTRVRAGDRLRVVGLEGATVAGERDRLKQLLVVLLDNALRYTPEDRGVDLSLVIDGADAVVRVEDDGIGIAPREREAVFERFRRGDAARRMNPGGTGLGLSIARWIAQRHGGSLVLEPRAPRGTTAIVRLPLSVAPAPASAPATPVVAGPAPAR